jgi:dTDP-4-dehydrorhamnose 3,5-epimerase
MTAGRRTRALPAGASGPRSRTHGRLSVMRYEKLKVRLDGPILLKPKVIGDERGFFCETYRRTEFIALGIEEEMVQDNHSRSSYGIVRGMHFQVGRGAAKLVRTSRGHIYDVIVDVRKGSPTFGEWEGFDLTDDNMHSLYVPVGFAHGFCVVSDVADVMYKQDRYFADATERGITYADQDVGIEWPVPAEDLAPSRRDATAPKLSEIADQLPFVYLGS